MPKLVSKDYKQLSGEEGTEDDFVNTERTYQDETDINHDGGDTKKQATEIDCMTVDGGGSVQDEDYDEQSSQSSLGGDNSRGNQQGRDESEETKICAKTVIATIPSVTIPSQEEQLTVSDSYEWYCLDLIDFEEMKNEILLHSPFKRYLISTCQWRPYTIEWEQHKRRWVPFCFGQCIILCLLALSFVFDGGLFCKVDTILSYDWNFEITRIRGILWETRWLLGNMIGLWYFNTRHMEWFLKAINMPKRIWKGFYKRAKNFMIFLIFACVVFPTVIQVYVINAYSKKAPPVWTQAIHLVGYALRRYTTFPIFLALISVLYLLHLFINISSQLVRYRLLNALCKRHSDEEAIQQKHEAIKRAARNSLKIIGQVKQIIFRTENEVKYFMLFHLVTLLVTAFLGIFSFMERLEFHVRPAPAANLTNGLKEFTLIQSHDNTTIMAQERLRKAIVALTEIQKVQRFSQNNEPITQSLIQVLNDTLTSVSEISKSTDGSVKMVLQSQEQQFIKVALKEQINRTRLYLQIVLDCAETALLYGFPLFLLTKIDSSVATVKQRMLDLQAEQETHRFEMTEKIWEVIKFMNTLRGIRIFGFQSTLFRTLILTFLGPILLSVVHSLLTYVNLPT